MQSEGFGLNAESRCSLYKLLSECYYPPDKSFIRHLETIDLSVGALIDDCVFPTPDADSLDSLKVDFSRLFIGPFKLLAPPYGSVYMENSGTIMGKSTLEVKELYRLEGLSLGVKEVPDHIAVELEFMYFLTFKEKGLPPDSESGRVVQCMEKEFYFLEQRLAPWITPFSSLVRKNAATTFYKRVADITEKFVKRDLEVLRNKIDTVCK